VSTRLYEEFLKPLLLVALFAPPEELSAGTTLAAFYFYSYSLHAVLHFCLSFDVICIALVWPATDRSMPFKHAHCSHLTLPVGAFSGKFRFLFAALAHQQDFDVCWCRGSVAETIFQPLIASIERSGGSIQGANNRTSGWRSSHHSRTLCSAWWHVDLTQPAAADPLMMSLEAAS
jgi:hypothetical protein